MLNDEVCCCWLLLGDIYIVSSVVSSVCVVFDIIQAVAYWFVYCLLRCSGKLYRSVNTVQSSPSAN